jgi:MYXO-CTERM domain-containing protein
MDFALDIALLSHAWIYYNVGYGNITLNYQDKEMGFAHGPSVPNPWADSALVDWVDHFSEQGLEDVAVSPGLSARGTFSIELELDESGLSEAFDLSLTSTPTLHVGSNMPYALEHEVTLSLLDVTLPDGTPLAEAGYSLEFESGLPWPVPEPASAAAWGFVALGAFVLVRRRRRTG